MPELEAQLRAYAASVAEDHVAPEPAALRSLAATLPLDELPDEPSSPRRSAFLAVAAILVVLAALGAGLVLARSGDDSTRITTDTTGTTVVPTPTVLPPVGDDPLVTCHPEEPGAYRRRALSGPVGAENASDPAAVALRTYLQQQELINAMLTKNSIPPLMPGATFPTGSWRRLYETDDRVLFSSGDLPLLSFAEAQRNVDTGEWVVSGRGSGTCYDLWVVPALDTSVAVFGFADGEYPTPDATELRLRVTRLRMPCGPPDLAPGDVLGPDVVESDDEVAVRVAIRGAPVGLISCPYLPPAAGQDAVTVTRTLSRPLGTRRIVNRGVIPEQPVIDPRTITGGEPAAVPRIELPGGDAEVQLLLSVNDTNVCDLRDRTTCTVTPQQASVTVRSPDGAAATGTSAPQGRIDVLAPAGQVTVSATADDRWCPTMIVDAAANSGGRSLECTRLDLPHGTVSGVVTTPDPANRLIRFQRANGAAPRTVEVALGPDGSFEATLEPGEWSVAQTASQGVVTCQSDQPNRFTLADGQALRLDRTCP